MIEGFKRLTFRAEMAEPPDGRSVDGDLGIVV